MKKKVLLVAVSLLTLALLAGCNQPQAAQPSAPATQAATEPAQEQVSAVPFANIAWTRDAENDIETLRFGDDGSFRYYCACGNPVNDSDLCEGYRYDAETKTIYLEYLETTEETIPQITVESYDKTTLVLNFGGQLRTFQVEEETPA